LPENTIKQILTTELKINSFKVVKVVLYKGLLKPLGPRYIEVINFNF
jgi:hypothetical protein